MSIAFIDLEAQRQYLGARIPAAIEKVLAHGNFILGPEVSELEAQLSAFAGVKHTITCANGTDALVLFLMTKQLTAQDAVFVPSFTFCATAEAVALVGATPVMIDVLPETFNMDPNSLEQGIERAKSLGLIPQGVIPVDLFGQPADYQALEAIAEKHHLWTLCDAAQSYGGQYQGRNVGTFGQATTTSFFPAKPLGCYGDGGALFTNDDDLAELLKSLRFHGKGDHKYNNVRIGQNSRLDTLQAAILLEKLAIFSEELFKRQKVADRYNQGLASVAKTPFVMNTAKSTWAEYTLILKEGRDRDGVAEKLKAMGVPTAVYYPIPLHLQRAYEHFPCATATLAVSESLAKNVISLPMHPYLEEGLQMRIIDAVRNVLG